MKIFIKIKKYKRETKKVARLYFSTQVDLLC